MVSMRHERYSTFSDPPVRSRNCSSARIVMMKLLLQPTWRWAVWPPILLFLHQVVPHWIHRVHMYVYHTYCISSNPHVLLYSYIYI